MSDTEKSLPITILIIALLSFLMVMRCSWDIAVEGQRRHALKIHKGCDKCHLQKEATNEKKNRN